MSSKKFKNKQKKYDLSNRLKSLRKSRGINSQLALQPILGIDRNRIQRLEAGHELYIGEAVAYADYFLISLDELVGREFRQPKAMAIPSNSVDAFIEIMESLTIIMKVQKRPDIIEALRGLVKDIAERRGVKEVAKKMSRKKYKNIA